MTFFTWLKALFMSTTPMSGTILKGDGSWPWHAQVDGQDIVISLGRATCFGGSGDPQDNGLTASGISTRAHPNYAGCALPMRDDHLGALRGSPLPRMPFVATVAEVTFLSTGKKITVPVIDLGPGKSTGNVIDLTTAAARQHDPHASPEDFAAQVSVRILGAAKHC